MAIEIFRMQGIFSCGVCFRFQMITSKESSPRSEHFFPKSAFFPVCLSSIMLGCLAELLLLANTKCDFEFDWMWTRKQKRRRKVCVWNESIREVVRVSPYFSINECALSRTKLWNTDKMYINAGVRWSTKKIASATPWHSSEVGKFSS